MFKTLVEEINPAISIDRYPMGALSIRIDSDPLCAWPIHDVKICRLMSVEDNIATKADKYFVAFLKARFTTGCDIRFKRNAQAEANTFRFVIADHR